MNRLMSKPESQEPILFDHTGGGANRRERASSPDPDRTHLTSEEYIAAYDYRKDPLIRHDFLKQLRKEHPELSILRGPYYPLYSSNVKIYTIDRNKMFTRRSHE